MAKVERRVAQHVLHRSEGIRSSLAAGAEQEAVVEAAVLLQCMSSEAGGACRPKQSQNRLLQRVAKVQRPGARSPAAKEGNVECGEGGVEVTAELKLELEVRALCVYHAVLFSVAMPSRSANENHFLPVAPTQALKALNSAPMSLRRSLEDILFLYPLIPRKVAR